MSFFPSRQTYIGLDSSKTTFKTACAKYGRGGWEISQLKEIAKEENVNPLYTMPKEAVVLSAIHSSHVLVRNLDIPCKNVKDVEGASHFQLEPLLPFPIDNAIIQIQILEKKEMAALTTTFAVRKDHLQKHLGEISCEPENITCVPYALAAFSTLLVKTGSPLLLVHVGEDEVTASLVEQGKLLGVRSFEKELDFVLEMQKTLLRFSTSYKTKPFETIFLLGDASFHEKLQEATSKTVLFPSSPTLSLSQEELIRFGLAIGIAISARGPNFRQKEYRYPHLLKKIKKPLLGCLIFSLLLFAVLLELNHLSLSQKKEAVKEAFSTLLELEGKKGISFEKPAEFLSALDDLEKEIELRPEIYPLLPQVPKVKDFLAWIASLDHVLGQNEKEIDIQSIHYVMVKRPDFSHKKEHYKVKVELEFSAKSQTAARLFHEALIGENPFVDAKEEFKWATSKGRYSAEFYLKDKTRYPL